MERSAKQFGCCRDTFLQHDERAAADRAAARIRRAAGINPKGGFQLARYRCQAPPAMPAERPFALSPHPRHKGERALLNPCLSIVRLSEGEDLVVTMSKLCAWFDAERILPTILFTTSVDAKGYKFEIGFRTTEEVARFRSQFGA